VSLSNSTVWSFWSSAAREQLFHYDLNSPDAECWKLRALDAAAACQDTEQQVKQLVAEGSDGSLVERNPSTFGHGIIWTLLQQQEAWKLEEEGFDAARVEQAVGQFLKELTLDELVFRWWMGRIFLPGRFSTSVISTALEEAQGRRHAASSAVMLREQDCESSLRCSVQEHLRDQAAGFDMGARMSDSESNPVQRASALAAAASEFIRICLVVWKRRHQVCGVAVSSVWASHAWFPASDIAEASETPLGCPVLLCAGGVSCVRAVHSWPERWWATLHLSRDISNYEKIELENVLEMSRLEEWRLCGTAWFLAQAVGNANLGVSLSLSEYQDCQPGQCMADFVHDSHEKLAACVASCAQRLTLSSLTDQLSSVSKALSAITQGGNLPATASVFGRRLEVLQGQWLDQCAANEPFESCLCLSDLLRGGILASETSYSCNAMRDLLLLCMYSKGETGQGLGQAAWSGLESSLSAELPSQLCLLHGLGLAAPPTTMPSVTGRFTLDEDVVMQAPDHSQEIVRGLSWLPTRPSDLWASRFRMPLGRRRGLGLRPSMASLQTLDFALELACWQRWDALRSWSASAVKREPPQKEVAAYMAGREWLASQRYAAARDAFSRAEGKASSIVEALQRASPPLGVPDEVLLPDVAFSEHLANLFRNQGQPEDEYSYLCRAAISAQASPEGTAGMRQRLWSAVFERALGLQKWDEAFETLLRIDAFENYLRMLSQKLRSCGRIELMLKLPEPHRSYFLSNLHEHASIGMPTAGSDSLACYQHLHALYFSDKEYLKAAGVAHSLYAAISSSLKHFAPSSREARSETSDFLAGDCISKAGEVPPSRPAGQTTLQALNPYARSLDHVWPLLEQQRSALLMLISALTLTPEKMLLVPSSKAFSSASLVADDMTALQSWFTQAEACHDMAISLADARRLLAIVEAEMVLSGRDSLPDPAATSEAVAELGLLRLALQVSRASGLDMWQCAFKPFVRLCLEAEVAPDEKVEAIASAARGPAISYMFTRSDGASPLGSGGSIRRAWWQTLEDSLKEVTSAKALDAAGARLFSLVANEILSSPMSGERRLPHFLVKALSQGQWVTLLRLYMKHRLLQESVELLSDRLNHHSQLQVTFLSAGRLSSPLADFPVTLVVQLLRAVQKRAKEELPGGPAASLATTLAGILRQFQVLLEDFEKNSR